MKNWLDNPITWRNYFKMAGICTVIGMVISGIGMCYAYWDTISCELDGIKDSIMRKFGK